MGPAMRFPIVLTVIRFLTHLSQQYCAKLQREHMLKLADFFPYYADVELTKLALRSTLRPCKVDGSLTIGKE